MGRLTNSMDVQLTGQAVAWACIAIVGLLVALGVLWVIRRNNEWDEDGETFYEDLRMYESEQKRAERRPKDDA